MDKKRFEELKQEKAQKLTALKQDRDEAKAQINSKYDRLIADLDASDPLANDQRVKLENAKVTELADNDLFYDALVSDAIADNTRKIQALQNIETNIDQDIEAVESKNQRLQSDIERLNQTKRTHMSRRLRNFLSFVAELIVGILIIAGIVLWIVQMLSISTHGFTASPTHLGRAAGQAIGKTLLILKHGIEHLF